MATPELALGEEYDIDGVHIEGNWEQGECRIVTVVDGWKRRVVDVDVNEKGGHIDGMDFESHVPMDEKQVLFGALAKLVRVKNPEIITVDDPDGNLL